MAKQSSFMTLKYNFPTDKAEILSHLQPGNANYFDMLNSIRHAEGPLTEFPKILLQSIVQCLKDGSDAHSGNHLWRDRSLTGNTGDVCSFELSDSPETLLPASRFIYNDIKGRKKQVVVVDFPENRHVPKGQAIVSVTYPNRRLGKWRREPGAYALCCGIWSPNGKDETKAAGTATAVMLVVRKSLTGNTLSQVARKTSYGEVPQVKAEDTNDHGIMQIPFLAFDEALRYCDFDKNHWQVTEAEMGAYGIKPEDVKVRVASQDFITATNEYDRIRFEVGRDIMKRDWQAGKRQDLKARDLFMFSMWVVQTCRKLIYISRKVLENDSNILLKLSLHQRRLVTAREYERQYLALVAELISLRQIPSDADINRMKQSRIEEVDNNEVIELDSSDIEDGDDPDYVPDENEAKLEKSFSNVKQEFRNESVYTEDEEEITLHDLETEGEEHVNKKARLGKQARETANPVMFAREQSEGSTIEVKPSHATIRLSRATTVTNVPEVAIKSEPSTMTSFEQFLDHVQFIFKDQAGANTRTTTFASCGNAAKLLEHAIVARIADKTSRMLLVQIGDHAGQPISCDDQQQFIKFIVDPLRGLWQPGEIHRHVIVVVTKYW